MCKSTWDTYIFIHQRFITAINNKQLYQFTSVLIKEHCFMSFLRFQWCCWREINQKQCVKERIVWYHLQKRQTFPVNYFGGQSISSRNSSILLISVLTSPLKVRKGGCVPGARFCRSAGFLQKTETAACDRLVRSGCLCQELPSVHPNLLRSTVVTLKTTPLSQRIMKRRWEKGQFPMLSPSLPACTQTQNDRALVREMEHHSGKCYMQTHIKNEWI